METQAQIQHFLDQERAWLRETIAEHGWAVQAVFGEGDEPPFAYTVGLRRFDGHPELLVVGLPEHASSSVLNQLGDRVRAGARLVAGVIVDDLLPGYPLGFVDVYPEASEELLISANDWYQSQDGPPVSALQVVWCDDRARLPWDAGYAPPSAAQPLYGNAPPRRS
jgi:hypothetical protein